MLINVLQIQVTSTFEVNKERKYMWMQSSGDFLKMYFGAYIVPWAGWPKNTIFFQAWVIVHPMFALARGLQHFWGILTLKSLFQLCRGNHSIPKGPARVEMASEYKSYIHCFFKSKSKKEKDWGDIIPNENPEDHRFEFQLTCVIGSYSGLCCLGGRKFIFRPCWHLVTVFVCFELY